MSTAHLNHLEELADMKGILNQLETELNSMRDQRDKLQEENNRLINQIRSNDTIIENQKYQLGQYAEEVEIMKFFARRYLAV